MRIIVIIILQLNNHGNSSSSLDYLALALRWLRSQLLASLRSLDLYPYYSITADDEMSDIYGNGTLLNT